MFYENNHVKTCTGMGTQIFDKSNSNPHETVTSSDRNPLGTSKKKMNSWSKKAVVIVKPEKRLLLKDFWEGLNISWKTWNSQKTQFFSQVLQKTWKVVHSAVSVSQKPGNPNCFHFGQDCVIHIIPDSTSFVRVYSMFE